MNTAVRLTLVMLGLVAVYLVLVNPNAVASALEALAVNMRKLTATLQGR